MLFQVLTEREETASVAIASNESFSKAHMFAASCEWRAVGGAGFVSADGDCGTSGAVSAGAARRFSGSGFPALALFLLPPWEALACPVLSFP